MAIVTAGTSDLPVAEEARVTAIWTGAGVTMITTWAWPAFTACWPTCSAAVGPRGGGGGRHGRGVAQRGRRDVACPVIAVPTCVGYGASFGGLAALLSMLNSCASGVSVVNIDNGFAGGYIAGLIAKNVAKARGRKRAVTATGRTSKAIVQWHPNH